MLQYVLVHGDMCTAASVHAVAFEPVHIVTFALQVILVCVLVQMVRVSLYG